MEASVINDTQYHGCCQLCQDAGLLCCCCSFQTCSCYSCHIHMPVPLGLIVVGDPIFETSACILRPSDRAPHKSCSAIPANAWLAMPIAVPLAAAPHCIVQSAISINQWPGGHSSDPSGQVRVTDAKGWQACCGRYAVRNTSRGIETCGVLAGQLDERSGLFKICTLILPKQTGTSDTVETLNEEDVFDVQVC